MNQLWQNEYVLAAANYSVIILCIIVLLAVFELVTKYKNWQEIKNGNIAVALTTGGKLLAIMNIFRFSIERNESFLVMLGWGIFGFGLLFAGYFIFEFLTPTFKIDEEIEKDNRAVGLISMAILIGLSYVIGAGIT
jgi:putative membrane protein